MSLYALKSPWKNSVLDYSKLQGKVLLIFNSATKCGLTPQLKELQELYEQYHPAGLEVIGYPSNQFKAQNPEDDDTTQSFCQLNYGVQFPMVNKSDVNGPETNEVFKLLKAKAHGVLGEPIAWNFTKFLVDKEGNVVRYAPTTQPSSLKREIEKLLASQPVDSAKY